MGLEDLYVFTAPREQVLEAFDSIAQEYKASGMPKYGQPKEGEYAGPIISGSKIIWDIASRLCRTQTGEKRVLDAIIGCYGAEDRKGPQEGTDCFPYSAVHCNDIDGQILPGELPGSGTPETGDYYSLFNIMTWQIRMGNALHANQARVQRMYPLIRQALENLEGCTVMTAQEFADNVQQRMKQYASGGK